MTEEQQPYNELEIKKMFDISFLPTVQKIAERAKEKLEDKDDLEFFHVALIFQFSELKEPLTYESIKDRIRMQLQPVTKKDLEEAKKNEEEAVAAK